MSTVAGYRKVFGDFLLTRTLKNRPSVDSPSGRVFKVVDKVNSAYVGAITRLKTAHPAAKKGRQPLLLQPSGMGPT